MNSYERQKEISRQLEEAKKVQNIANLKEIKGEGYNGLGDDEFFGSRDSYEKSKVEFTNLLNFISLLDDDFEDGMDKINSFIRDDNLISAYRYDYCALDDLFANAPLIAAVECLRSNISSDDLRKIL